MRVGAAIENVTCAVDGRLQDLRLQGENSADFALVLSMALPCLLPLDVLSRKVYDIHVQFVPKVQTWLNFLKM